MYKVDVLIDNNEAGSAHEPESRLRKNVTTNIDSGTVTRTPVMIKSHTDAQ